MSKVADKEKILQAARNKLIITYNGTPYDYKQTLAEIFQAKREGMTYSKCERKKLPT